MKRLACFLVVLSTGAIPVVPAARADSFDDYTNRHLMKVVDSKNAEKVKSLSLEDLVVNSQVLPGHRSSAFLIVRTNEGRLAKILVQAARQKISKDESVPILLIERFVTFLDGEDRTVIAEAKNIRLFNDFRLSLDIGQIVPAALTADLRFSAEKNSIKVEPVGKAELFLVTKHLSEAAPEKGGKVAVGAKFETQSFNGVYKLEDDGKRGGKLHLKVGQNGTVGGFFYSDDNGAKYDVEGQVSATPVNNIQFRITYPRSTQFFTGWMFMSDGRLITGFSRINEREAGFLATRLPE
jgi:hypothetical protein